MYKCTPLSEPANHTRYHRMFYIRFFPPLFHLKAVANTWRQKALDIALIVFGIISMVYTTYITIMQWSMGHGEQSPVSRCIEPGNWV